MRLHWLSKTTPVAGRARLSVTNPLNQPQVFYFYVCLVWFSVFQEKVPPYNSPGCTGNHFVDQVGLELPALGSKACATMPSQSEFIK